MVSSPLLRVRNIFVMIQIILLYFKQLILKNGTGFLQMPEQYIYKLVEMTL